MAGVPAALAEPLQLTARPIERFNRIGADAAGPLVFLGGLEVASTHPEFGGFSGIAVADDGAGVVLINDYGSVLRARLVHAGGRLTGIAEGDIAPLDPDGTMAKRSSDAEDIAFDPADPNRGVIVRERQANAMLAFTLVNGRPAHFTPVRVGAPDTILRSNAGLESVAYAPPGSPQAGRIVGIAEAPPHGPSGGGGDVPGWIVGAGAFAVVRRDGYSISSARFLPDGDLMLLERRLSPLTGLGVRLRRIPGDTVRPGSRLDGAILLDAGMTSQIDNMEGLAVSRGADGRTILTLVSDDNFRMFQRTLILQFALPGP